MAMDAASICEEEGREHAAAFYELLGHQEAGGVSEVRSLSHHGPRVAYVKDAESFVARAFEANRNGGNVYVGLQPRPSAFFVRAPNAWQAAKGGSTGNVARAAEIEVVCALALDIDVATDARVGRPATDEELDPCIAVGRQLLALGGFAGSSTLVLTGNGVQAVAPIEPVTVEEGTAAGLRALENQLIASLHSLPPGVKVDRIADLPRIVRVPGTMNFKGEPCPGRPHRRAQIVLLPEIGGRSMLLAEQLRELAQCAGSNAKVHRVGLGYLRGDLKRFKTCEYLRWMVRDPATVPEPAWMELLVQCSALVGGDALAHEISARDPGRYVAAKTQARLDRIRSSGYRPRRCERLPGRNGDFRCPRLASCQARRPLELAALPHSQETHPMKDEAKQQPGRLPKYVARCGAISATVWPTTRTVEGELREYFTIEIVKNYRDAGKWRKTSRFWPDDLPAVITVAQSAYRDLRVREEWPASHADESRAGNAESAAYAAEGIIPEEGGDAPEEG